VIVTGDVSLNANLFVKQDASFNANLFVGNFLSVNNDASFNRRVFVTGDVSLNANLFVKQDVSFNENLFVGGNINLTNTSSTFTWNNPAGQNLTFPIVITNTSVINSTGGAGIRLIRQDTNYNMNYL
jgi:hypothetical protein